ncbi:MAG: GNAT family N-acetyltransferase, partial [Clostridia bacterium]|nr:GNAT family N-acetyltransferase [Clostridia bacterium]
MIRQLDNEEHLMCLPDDILSGYIKGLYGAYGADQGFLRFYGDEHGGMIAVMDGTATVCCSESSYEETAWFLNAQPDIRTVRTDRSFAQTIHGQALEIRSVMRCQPLPLSTVDAVSVSPRDLYPFLAGVFPDFPPFEEWYLDVSYRTRHGFCRNCAIVTGGAVAASAMTVAEWETGAVIGAVATAAEHRRKGYASACVTALIQQLQAEGKQVLICPKNSAAQRLYESIGF